MIQIVLYAFMAFAALVANPQTRASSSDEPFPRRGAKSVRPFAYPAGAGSRPWSASSFVASIAETK